MKTILKQIFHQSWILQWSYYCNKGNFASFPLCHPQSVQCGRNKNNWNTIVIALKIKTCLRFYKVLYNVVRTLYSSKLPSSFIADVLGNILWAIKSIIKDLNSQEIKVLYEDEKEPGYSIFVSTKVQFALKFK